MVQRHPKLKQIKLGKNIQKELAVELCRKANVAFGPCGLGEIARFQGILGEYQIVIIDFHARNGVIYEGPSRGKKIVLYKNGDHYDVVNPDKMPSLVCQTFFFVISVRFSITITFVIHAMIHVTLVYKKHVFLLKESEGNYRLF